MSQTHSALLSPCVGVFSVVPRLATRLHQYRTYHNFVLLILGGLSLAFAVSTKTRFSFEVSGCHSERRPSHSKSLRQPWPVAVSQTRVSDFLEVYHRALSLPQICIFGTRHSKQIGRDPRFVFRRSLHKKSGRWLIMCDPQCTRRGELSLPHAK